MNPSTEIDRITDFIRTSIHKTLKRKGAVLGISGGIDSSVVLALCVRALGPKHVVALMLPEGESSPKSAELAGKLAGQFGVQTITEDITPALEGFGCYRRRNEAIRRLFPDFKAGWGAKIVLPGNLLESTTLNIFRLTVTDPEGREYTKRLPPAEYLQIVAASNFKQRTRMAMLYYHAEARNYAVVGTANRNEHALGFFVKHGDGGVDLQPIGHLFKTQVYQLAELLDIPAEIRTRTPTSDTYPGGSTQEEFFFRLPFAVLDAIWEAHDRSQSPAEIANRFSLEEEQVLRVVEDIQRKHNTTAYLRQPTLFLDSE